MAVPGGFQLQKLPHDKGAFSHMKRVLVTGATGFVGANLTRRLLADGHEVHLFAREESNLWRLHQIRRDVQLHSVSLDERDAVDEAIQQIKPEWIFHLAAHGAYSWQQDVDRIFKVNVTGTINLVDACVRAGFESLVNAGSSS